MEYIFSSACGKSRRSVGHISWFLSTHCLQQFSQHGSEQLWLLLTENNQHLLNSAFCWKRLWDSPVFHFANFRGQRPNQKLWILVRQICCIFAPLQLLFFFAHWITVASLGALLCLYLSYGHLSSTSSHKHSFWLRSALMLLGGKPTAVWHVKSYLTNTFHRLPPSSVIHLIIIFMTLPESLQHICSFFNISWLNSQKHNFDFYEVYWAHPYACKKSLNLDYP